MARVLMTWRDAFEFLGNMRSCLNIGSGGGKDERPDAGLLNTSAARRWERALAGLPTRPVVIAGCETTQKAIFESCFVDGTPLRRCCGAPLRNGRDTQRAKAALSEAIRAAYRASEAA